MMRRVRGEPQTEDDGREREEQKRERDLRYGETVGAKQR